MVVSMASFVSTSLIRVCCADIEKALDACEAKAEGQSAAAIENGKDYRCYMEKAVNMTSRSEVLK